MHRVLKKIDFEWKSESDCEILIPLFLKYRCKYGNFFRWCLV